MRHQAAQTRPDCAMNRMTQVYPDYEIWVY